jgi:hypothetical protein
MPALGRYQIAVFLRFGQGAFDQAGVLPLDVIASGPSSPRPLPGRPEVQAAVAGETMMRPLPASAWKRGDYRVLAVLVNTSAEPVYMGPMRATLKVVSKARPLDCAPALLETRIDAVTLRPGHPRAFPLPVRCDLGAQGDYDIHVALATADAGPFDLGRLQLRVKEEVDLGRLPDDRGHWIH